MTPKPSLESARPAATAVGFTPAMAMPNSTKQPSAAKGVRVKSSSRYVPMQQSDISVSARKWRRTGSTNAIHSRAASIAPQMAVTVSCPAVPDRMPASLK